MSRLSPLSDPRGRSGSLSDRVADAKTPLDSLPADTTHERVASRSLLVFEQVSKWYGPVIGVNQVSLELRPGITGLVGTNGAGKSTLLRLAAGQLTPDLGRVHVQNVNTASPSGKMYIGYCPEHDRFYEELSGRKFVEIMARLSGFTARRARERTDEILELVGMNDRASKPIAGYSKGMRQRIKLAQALLHDPDVLLLDEPLSGIDPIGRREFVDLFHLLAERNKCLLISSHELEELDKLTDFVAIMAFGRIAAVGPLMQVRDMLDNHPLSILVASDDNRRLAQAMLDWQEVVGVDVGEQNRLIVRAQKGESILQALDVAGGRRRHRNQPRRNLRRLDRGDSRLFAWRPCLMAVESEPTRQEILQETSRFRAWLYLTQLSFLRYARSRVLVWIAFGLLGFTTLLVSLNTQADRWGTWHWRYPRRVGPRQIEIVEGLEKAQHRLAFGAESQSLLLATTQAFRVVCTDSTRFAVFTRWIVFSAFVTFLLPLFSLTFATEALGREREERNLIWLLTRPISRPAAYLAKYLALLPWSLGLNVGGFAVICWAGGEPGRTALSLFLARSGDRHVCLLCPVSAHEHLVSQAGDRGNSILFLFRVVRGQSPRLQQKSEHYLLRPLHHVRERQRTKHHPRTSEHVPSYFGAIQLLCARRRDNCLAARGNVCVLASRLCGDDVINTST